MKIIGVNAVTEALHAGRVKALAVSNKRHAGLAEVFRLAELHRIPVTQLDEKELERVTDGQRHQGVVASLAPQVLSTISDLVQSSDLPLIVVLDGIEDPHNFGAIARVAEAVGAAGLVVQTRRAAPVSAAAVRASAGALAHLRLSSVVNLSRALDELKSAGIWTVGLDLGSDRSIYDIDFRQPTAIVVGSEGRGLRRLVRERCDWKATLPMRGRVGSLNASVAAGAALFEAVRQRTRG
ncbi:MAG: 23S rRNA (guanosine(2251)-2'-O)-methyltransferase RlmB [Acidobacteriota bacterium]|nr:23S rRNA (guanosine(2251)-2'-O)-methyltransferase RlmB [Acidobacteriota bacterium]